MFTDEELFEIARILAIVLHLGNIQYNGKSFGSELLKILPFPSLAQSSKGIDGVSIKDPKLVEFIASLLEVREKFSDESELITVVRSMENN